MDIKAAQLHGAIFLEFQKSTKMTLTRYMNLMEKQLKHRIDGPVKFKPVPDYTQLFQGKIDIIINTPVSLLILNLKLCCTRTTTENGEKFGLITLQGVERLGSHDLNFNLCLMSDFKWTSQEDLSQVPWQKITIKLPPTHLTLDAMEGNFRLAFYDHLSRWESTEIIDKKIKEIIKTRGTQHVHIADKKGDRPKQEADYDTDMRMASAPPSLPMIPTP